MENTPLKTPEAKTSTSESSSWRTNDQVETILDVRFLKKKRNVFEKRIKEILWIWVDENVLRFSRLLNLAEYFCVRLRDNYNTRRIWSRYYWELNDYKKQIAESRICDAEGIQLSTNKTRIKKWILIDEDEIIIYRILDENWLEQFIKRLYVLCDQNKLNFNNQK